MCNRYEPADERYLHDTWREYERSIGAYKPHVGPRDMAPFVVPGRVLVGQWGMIRPGQPERVAKDARGRPLMTNNARIETVASKPTYRDAWKRGQRCLIPAVSFDEPYWGTGKNIWWRFRRADGQPWALAGLWSEWTDRTTGEVVPNFTMLTMNCDAYPVLSKMHKPDPTLPDDQQDKRTVIPIERADWAHWLAGAVEDVASLIRLPAVDVIAHAPADASISTVLS